MKKYLLSILCSVDQCFLGPASPILPSPLRLFPPNHWPSIYFAVSLLKCDKVPEAIELLQRLTDFPPLYGLSIGAIPGYFEQWPIPAVKAHYWLGVAFEKQGKTDKAKIEYTKFLDIWKEADFISPELRDAKERVSKLGGIAKK